MADSIFKTTELSYPQFEKDGLRFLTVKSQHLKGRGDICVFVPKGENMSDLPIVTLLHGVYGSAWVWAFLGGAHLTAQKLIKEKKLKPMVLAMPSDGLWGDGSGYVAHNERDFEKWIAEDVITAVRENISQTSLSSPLFISGLSMGGFGALKIGSKYARQYSGISAHSSITNISQLEQFIEEPVEDFRQPILSDEDVLSSILSNKGLIPPLRFDCGTDDELLRANSILHKQLTDASIDHLYEEFSGGHEWPYWQKHLEDTLYFFNGLIRSRS